MNDGRMGALPGAPSNRELRGWGLSEVLFGIVLAGALMAVVLAGRFAYREGALLEGAKGNAQAVARWAEAVAAAHERGDALPGGPCALVPGAPPVAVPAPMPVPAPELAASVAPLGQAVGLEPIAEPATPDPVVPAAMGDATATATATAPPATDPPGPAADPAPVQVTWQSCREALFGQSGALADLSNPFDPANTVLGARCEKRMAATRGFVLVDKGVAPPGASGSAAWAPLQDSDLIAKGLALRIQVCDAGGYVVKVAEVTL